MTYEQLDAIADAYIPALGIVLLATIALKLITKHFTQSRSLTLELLISLVLVYGLMALDNWLNIWPKLSMDYSTHTALSLALVLILVNKKQSILTGLNLAFSTSFVAYCGLMLYQEYHSLADIVSTGLVIGGGYFLLIRLARIGKNEKS